jgi:hypothetical protein
MPMPKLTNRAGRSKPTTTASIVKGLRLLAWQRRYVAPVLAQRRPLVIHSFALNLTDPTLAYVESLDDEKPRLSHVHLVIPSVHQGQENLLAPTFRKLFVFFCLDHGGGMIPWSAGRQQAQLDPGDSCRLRVKGSPFALPLLATFLLVQAQRGFCTSYSCGFALRFSWRPCVRFLWRPAPRLCYHRRCCTSFLLRGGAYARNAAPRMMCLAASLRFQREVQPCSFYASACSI